MRKQVVAIAPRSSQLVLGCFRGWWGQLLFCGNFSVPLQDFGVGVTGANNSSPQPFGDCSSAEDSEESFIYRTLKVEQVSASQGERGGTRKKTRTGPLVQVCKGAGGPSSSLCSPDPDTLFRIVLCVGIAQAPVRSTEQKLVLEVL